MKEDENFVVRLWRRRKKRENKNWLTLLLLYEGRISYSRILRSVINSISYKSASDAFHPFPFPYLCSTNFENCEESLQSFHSGWNSSTMNYEVVRSHLRVPQKYSFHLLYAYKIIIINTPWLYGMRAQRRQRLASSAQSACSVTHGFKVHHVHQAVAWVEHWVFVEDPIQFHSIAT